ncbi:hypothetical protein [Actinoplanes teichomyceticus]|uniref:DUF4333 domain-containing protein n=1 Tax=Actinoplanes teichomyceticus TaxID=1867 RepID=A0A561WID2_ACTTI|nr:hypothetical protein [Actinoplanes teichomyceticus]TWG23639.1 hypothetical protein FHX34_102188 [Actinoplanes teichomyceticus]GIF11678.1 hypothetical protein Ate01nite_17100 [Actinoplanes teichomyceticus]
MTTVHSPQSAHGHPMSPPWAERPETATLELETPPFGGVVPPYGSPGNKHGQLLVRFPQEVLGAARPEAPSWRPVVAWTFFLSVLGVVSAMRRAGRAREYGRRRAPYWVAFVVTCVAGAAFWSALVVDVALPVYRIQAEDRATAAVQEKVRGDGRVEAAVGTTVKSGGCVPVSDRDAEGMRRYDCTFRLSDGRSASMVIEADTRGNWETTG